MLITYLCHCLNNNILTVNTCWELNMWRFSTPSLQSQNVWKLSEKKYPFFLYSGSSQNTVYWRPHDLAMGKGLELWSHDQCRHLMASLRFFYCLLYRFTLTQEGQLLFSHVFYKGRLLSFKTIHIWKKTNWK